jgi:dihydroxy-acid dehydratase
MAGKYSQIITKNISNVGPRSMLYAVKSNMNKSHIGVISMYNTNNPCNIHLGKLQDIVINSLSNYNAFKFNVASVSDGISMGTSGMNYSLPSRELISNSIETISNAYHHDGLITIPSCDKTIPGSLMGMIALDKPSILVYGGSILPGKYKNQDVDIVDAFQSQTKITDSNERENFIKVCCDKKGGSCSGMYTANTMAIVSEVLGLSLPNSSSTPAASNLKELECKTINKFLDNLIINDIKPSDILTKNSFKNAINVIYALGGSTNAILHLLAIAKYSNIKLSLNDFKQHHIPVIGNFKPSYKYRMIDLHKIGGTVAVIRYLSEIGYFDPSALTVSGRTWEELIKIPLKLDFKKQNVILPIENPIKKDSHIKVLNGNLAPEGCVAKVKNNNYFSGPVKVFDDEDEFIKKFNSINNGDVILIRYQGPKGGPGMPEMLKATSAISGSDLDVALITDGRFSGGSTGLIIGHLSPEAYEQESLLNIIQDDDIIKIDLKKNIINVNLSKNEINYRRNNKNLIYKEKKPNTLYLRSYQNLVSSSSEGCIIKI